MDTIEKVAEFHTAFQHPILTSPQIPSTERMALRFNLLTDIKRSVASYKEFAAQEVEAYKERLKKEVSETLWDQDDIKNIISLIDAVK